MQDSTAPGTGATGANGIPGSPALSSSGSTPPGHAAAGVGTSTPPPAAPETDLWAGRSSWKHFAGRIVLWLLAVAAMAVFAWLGASRMEGLTGKAAAWLVFALGGVSGAVVWLGIALGILSTRYRLTSQRLFITRGILSQTVDQTELIRVDDVRLFKSLWGRLMNVGTVTVITTDATDHNTQIEGVSNPDQVAEAIRLQMRALRGRSVYLETL